MWDDSDPFSEDNIKNTTEQEDFKHCKRSDFKYSIYHTTGIKYTFTQESNINNDNAVS